MEVHQAGHAQAGHAQAGHAQAGHAQEGQAQVAFYGRIEPTLTI